MPGSLELVDNHDQKSRGYYGRGRDNRRAATTTTSGRGGGTNDLIFTVEDHDGIPVGIQAHRQQEDDTNFGFEDELDFEAMARRRARRKRGCVFGMFFLSFFAAGIFAHIHYGGVSGGRLRHGDKNTGGGNYGEETEEVIIVNEEVDNSEDSEAMGSSSSSTVEGGVEEFEKEAEKEELWQIASPNPEFEICSPPLKSNDAMPLFHIGQFITIPEAPSQTGSDNDNPTESLEERYVYALSAMDISDDASIISIGFADYAGPPHRTSDYTYYSVGMVRTFAYDCEQSKYRQVGQDLRGSNDGEQFGHRVSTSADGKTMAISAPSESYSGGNGFVNVYYLDDGGPAAESSTAPAWTKLGSRIDNLDSTSHDRIGHAISLSSNGQTLAILGVQTDHTYIVRVFKYNPIEREWKMRGESLLVSVNYDDLYEFAPQLSLRDDGSELSISDPESGIVRYRYKWQENVWDKMVEEEQQYAAFSVMSDAIANYTADGGMWWIDSVATDRDADVIAFTSWTDTADTYDVHSVKLVDFSLPHQDPVVAYNVTWKDYSVGVNVAVAKEGGVAAVVVSKTDVDDDEFWSDSSTVGALTVLHRDDAGGVGEWAVIGKDTDSEGMGVLGDFVSLSGDGRIVAIGSTDVVELYGVILHPTNGHAVAKEDEDNDDNKAEAAATDKHKFDICPPSWKGETSELNSLPLSPEEHTIALALSSDASFIAIGIDSNDGEDRGFARIYGWSCADAKYIQVGQDLFGTNSLDGFGQSVDLSSDGRTMVVGANQPPPGKSGYVSVYNLDEAAFEWVLVGHRIDQFPKNVGDVGREVKISHDGAVVTFSGYVLEEEENYVYGHSFIRTVVHEHDEWKEKGDDLIGSIDFDEHGTEMHISMSGDGNTLAVVGSYSTFLAKVYIFNSHEKNWTESVIPVPSQEEVAWPDSEEYDDDGEVMVSVDDEEFYQYFNGGDVSLNGNGKILAVAGNGYCSVGGEYAYIRMLHLEDGGDWMPSTDPMGSTEKAISSVDVDDAGLHLAMGVNSHSDDLAYQGGLFVATAVTDSYGDKLLDWLGESTGIVVGTSENDLLGSRVAISSDGTVAAASSRKGYIAFYKT